MVPMETNAVTLTHLTLEFGSPLSESARRVIPAIGIKTRNTFANDTYSARDLPKIIESSSCIYQLVERFMAGSTLERKNFFTELTNYHAAFLMILGFMKSRLSTIMSALDSGCSWSTYINQAGSYRTSY